MVCVQLYFKNLSGKFTTYLALPKQEWLAYPSMDESIFCCMLPILAEVVKVEQLNVTSDHYRN
jgi:hypothetical protein